MKIAPFASREIDSSALSLHFFKTELKTTAHINTENDRIYTNVM
jgi:hypothetical protein